jgi:hypothetical protein
LQQLTGTFPLLDAVALPGQPKGALADTASQGLSAAWTNGVFTTLPIPDQPTLVSPWTVYAVAFQAKGVLQPTGGTARFGRLGRLLAGVIPLYSAGTQHGGGFSGNPYLDPPPAATPSLITLWDGSQDPPFPYWQSGPAPTGGFVNGTVEFPNPIQLVSGENIGIGAWLTPSLTYQLAVSILTLAYTILYDI